MRDHIQATSSVYAYESGECPACAHTVHKNNTLTPTRPPRLNKWFHMYAYESGECPACAHAVHKNNTLTHTRPPRLNKWFHIHAYESGECPACAHTVHKNNTLTHTRPPRLNKTHTRPPRLNKWFHIYAYESGECPACVHTVHKNNTLTHTRPPRLNKWFQILPSFVFLVTACSLPECSLYTFIYDQTALLDTCYFDRRQCTHDVISLTLSPLCGRRVKHHVKLGIFKLCASMLMLPTLPSNADACKL